MTAWCENVCNDWAMKRNSSEVNAEDKFIKVPINIIDGSDEEMDYWLAKFVVEVRKTEAINGIVAIRCTSCVVDFNVTFARMAAQR